MEKQSWVPAERPLPALKDLALPEISSSPKLVFDSDLILKNLSVGPSALVSDLEMNYVGAEVTLLQELLIKGGYLDSTSKTGYFGEKTREAVIQFQLKRGIIKSQKDHGAGRVGPKTRQALSQNS